MKFNEKLIELRKKAGLSQEELGYKLNVTRQTVSKWELGETTPEMAKLAEISKIFNMSVDDLINDSQIKTNENPIIEDKPIQDKNPKNNKLVIIIVVLLIVVIVTIVGKAITTFTALNMFNDVANQGIEEEAKGIFDRVFKLFDKVIDGQLDDDKEDKIKEATDKINTSMLNLTLELYNGSNNGVQVKKLLEDVITSNKKEDRKITVKYLETETQDTSEIQNLKTKIKDSNNFEVSFDYDEDKIINKVTIQKSISEFEVKSFNNSLELYAGSRNGMIVTNVLDKIITSNKTEDRKITVECNGTETQDETEIKNIKRNFETFDNCEITYEYDENGFINKAIIEKL